MSIEFNCSQCGRLLQTPDSAAGRQAQCPQCGSLSIVPAGPPERPTLTPERPSLGPQASPPDPNAWPEALAGSPFGGVWQGGENPYQSPPSSQSLARGYSDAQAAERLSGPAMALIIVSILSIVADVVIFGMGMIGVTIEPDPAAPPFVVLAVVGFVMYVLVPGTISGLIIAGAVKMRQVRAYSLAMAAAILALLPCNFCCLFTLPFGIWALVVMSDIGVRNAFRS